MLLFLWSCVKKQCNHEEVIDNAIAPTCTQTGLTDGKHCATCGEVLIKQEIVAALGHTEVIDKAIAPTCTENGLTEGSHCSVCNEVLIVQQVDAATHIYGEPNVITSPNCFADGEQKLICSLCGCEETQAVSRLEHNFEIIENTEYNKCSLCGIFEFDGHFYMIIDIDTTWTKAKEYCENLGGHMVTITSEEENKFINYIIEQMSFTEYWIGGIKQNSVWKWITGEAFEYTCWGSREPNNNANQESYLETWWGYGWNDTTNVGQDNTSIGIICEWDN